MVLHALACPLPVRTRVPRRGKSPQSSGLCQAFVSTLAAHRPHRKVNGQGQHVQKTGKQWPSWEQSKAAGMVRP